MKTQTNTTDIASSLFTRMHSLMVVAGVVIAIVCSLILFAKIDASSKNQTKQSFLIEASKSTINHEVAKMKNVSLVFAQSLLK